MRGFPVHGISDIETIRFCTNTLRYTAVFKQEKYSMQYLDSFFDSYIALQEQIDHNTKMFLVRPNYVS